MSIDRRHFLKTLAGSTAFGASTLHQSIARALSIPAKAETGSILDVKRMWSFSCKRIVLSITASVVCVACAALAIPALVCYVTANRVVSAYG